MSKRNFCQACSFLRYGVKTRIEIPHTCGGDGSDIIRPKHEYVPTREDMEKYLAKLKELMEADERCKLCGRLLDETAIKSTGLCTPCFTSNA